jgi:hypothetical protein
VVLVANPEPVRAVLSDAYPLLGLSWNPRTVGSVSDHVPGVTIDEVRDALSAELAKVLPVGPAAAASAWTVGRPVPLRDCWEVS